jgi:hypothetical protein
MSNDQYSPQIVVDENAFWSGLSSVSSSFINSQYYWDEPYMYEGSAAYYVDRVNVAFTEGQRVVPAVPAYVRQCFKSLVATLEDEVERTRFEEGWQQERQRR